MNRLHLIVDADDTLWENNIYFERAFEEFTEFLAHSSMKPQRRYGRRSTRSSSPTPRSTATDR